MRAVKNVTSLQSKEYEERLRELGLPSLQARRKENDIVQVYKILHGVDDVDRQLWFETVGEGNQERARTRARADQWKIKRQFGKTEIRRQSFAVRMPDRWNGLDLEARTASNIKSFKVEYRKSQETKDTVYMYSA